MGNHQNLKVVTGAFGYTGQYIARALLQRGFAVRTLTAHPLRPNQFSGAIEAVPFNFERPAVLAESLRGATTVINTYWIRFERGSMTFARAVENIRTLIDAARQAGVQRFVQVSITNASAASQLPYFRGKGVIEDTLRKSGLSYAIVRPTVIFGREDILISNLARSLRRFPVFAVPDTGEYRLQPVFVEDMAKLIVDAANANENVELDAVGPEIFTFNELLQLLARSIGSTARIVHVPPIFALFCASIIGRVMGDVMLTADEIRGLQANLLVSSAAPTGSTRLSDWLGNNASWLGERYASELARRT